MIDKTIEDLKKYKNKVYFMKKLFSRNQKEVSKNNES